MIVTLSPAKLLNEAPSLLTVNATVPHFAAEAHTLFEALAPLSVAELAKLLKVNRVLAQQTYERIHTYLAGAAAVKPALLAYDGAVFKAFAPETLTPQQQHYTAEHLLLFSGIYGLLAPFDAIAPYRLDIADGLRVASDSLYTFWGRKLTELLNQRLLADDGVWINLASAEYTKAVDRSQLAPSVRCITPQFKELRPDGSFKTIVMATKKARGMMARFILEREITNPEELKGFTEGGYGFMESLSSESDWLFVR